MLFFSDRLNQTAPPGTPLAGRSAVLFLPQEKPLFVFCSVSSALQCVPSAALCVEALATVRTDGADPRQSCSLCSQISAHHSALAVRWEECPWPVQMATERCLVAGRLHMSTPGHGLSLLWVLPAEQMPHHDLSARVPTLGRGIGHHDSWPGTCHIRAACSSWVSVLPWGFPGWGPLCNPCFLLCCRAHLHQRWSSQCRSRFSLIT